MHREYLSSGLLGLVMKSAWVVGWSMAVPVVAQGESGSWKAALKSTVAEANRLIVAPSGSLVEARKITPHLVFELGGNEKVEDFIDVVQVNDALGLECKCYGRWAFHFYRNKELLATIGYAHFDRLKWKNSKWKGDALLTEESRVEIPLWFKKNDFPNLYEAREAEFEKNRMGKAENELFEGLLREARDGDPVSLAVAVCKALSVSRSTMNSPQYKERRALAKLNQVSSDEFLLAMKQLRNSPEYLVGAAGIFFQRSRARPKHLDGVRDNMPPDMRLEWTLRLSEAVLTHGHDDDKPWILRHLARYDEPAVVRMLHLIAAGEIGRERDRPREALREPSNQVGALLALALLNDETIHLEVEQRLKKADHKQDVAALELCLALLGDPSFIKNEHFSFGSYSIGLAGLTAIERFNGEYGMDVLVESGFSHPWMYVKDQAVVTFDKLTGTEFADVSRDAYDWQQARAWWDSHGEEFKQRHRAESTDAASEKP